MGEDRGGGGARSEIRAKPSIGRCYNSAMNREQVIQALRRHERDIRAGGATALFLFGSALRGEAGPRSDVDLFIDYDEAGDFSLIELIRLKADIAGYLGTEVDLTTRAGLHPAIRDRILAEAERVF